MEVKNKIKKNPWVISTTILGILGLTLLILLIGNFYRRVNKNIISEKEAGQQIIDLGRLQLEEEIELLSVKEEGGLYNITFLSKDGKFSVYLTLDGENFIGYLTPFSTLMEQIKQEKEFGCGGRDWTVFKNELPSEIKSKILSFTKVEPKEYEDKIMEFMNYDEIPNTLIVFYNPGCGWCVKYHPVLIEVQEKYPKLEIYALDLSNNKAVADKYNIQGTPANVINGKYSIGGYMPVENLSKILDKCL